MNDSTTVETLKAEGVNALYVEGGIVAWNGSIGGLVFRGTVCGNGKN